MLRTLAASVALVLLAVSALCGKAVPLPKECPIRHAVAHAGHSWAMYSKFDTARVWAIPLSDLSKGIDVFVGRSNTAPPRFHIGQGSLWVSTTDTSPMWYSRPSAYECSDQLTRFPTSKLLKGDKLTEDEKDGRIDGDKSCGHIFVTSMTNWIRSAARDVGYGMEPKLYSGTIATGPTSARQFVTSCYRFSKKGAKLVDGIVMTERDTKKPVWSLTAYTVRQKADEWWEKDFNVQFTFREPFTVFDVGRYSYFLTDSGSLYRVFSGANWAMTRTAHPVWEDKKRPIVALVEDADEKQAYLFVGPEKEGGKPAYFAAGQKPELVPYDPADLPQLKNAPDKDKLKNSNYASAVEAQRYALLLVKKRLIKAPKP